MRNLVWLAPLGVSLSTSCAVSTDAKPPPRISAPASNCHAENPQALTVQKHDTKARLKGHAVLAPTTVKFIEASHAEGPCADQIVKYVSSNGTLASGQVFAISATEKVQLHPRQGLDTPHELPSRSIRSLAGYNLVMVQRVRLRRSPEGDRASYIGLFRSRTDFVVARFDVLDGKPSREAELLLRSRRPIDSIDFLGAPDWPAGWIGLVEQAGEGEAWLYSYRWDYGDLRPLEL